MKRCRTCNRTYTDPNLSYCVDDGTPLTTEIVEDEPYRPPSAYVPPETVPDKRRRAWPWIVGILGAFILGVVGLMVAAAILVPRIVRKAPIVATNTNTDNTDRTDQSKGVNTPPPTDERQVMGQLAELENEWTIANLEADKTKLARILADDYVGPSAEGGLQGKKEYIDTIERDSAVERWEFKELKLQLSGDRATLTGKITYFARGEETAFDFTDKFVWRDGRWQATGSAVQRRE